MCKQRDGVNLKELATIDRLTSLRLKMKLIWNCGDAGPFLRCASLKGLFKSFVFVRRKLNFRVKKVLLWAETGLCVDLWRTCVHLSTLTSSPSIIRAVMETNGISSDEVENEAQNEICCLIEDSVKCRRPAGNASFSKRIQKTVQRKLKLSLDSFVSLRFYFAENFRLLNETLLPTGQAGFPIYLWLPQVEDSVCAFEEAAVDEAFRRLWRFRSRRLRTTRGWLLFAAGSDTSKI